MKIGSNPIFFIRQTDVSRELLIPSSIVRFLVRFFRVVDGGRAKSEIKQQKEGGRERKRERERGRQPVTKWNSTVSGWKFASSSRILNTTGSRNSLEKALENTPRDGKREGEREREGKPDSTSLDPARSIFFPLSTVNLSWGDRLARPASFLHVDLSRRNCITEYIFDLFSR